MARRLEDFMAGDVLEQHAADRAHLQELYVVRDLADRPILSDELLAAIQKLNGPARAVFERLLTEGFAGAVQK